MRGRRKNESGFALLLVFLMAAILAITLYKEIPRVAFETQRQKELLLIERGEQYKRAIALFYAGRTSAGRRGSRTWRTPTTSTTCGSGTRTQ